MTDATHRSFFALLRVRRYKMPIITWSVKPVNIGFFHVILC